MELEFCFKYNPDPAETEEIIKFYNSFDVVSVAQHPEFTEFADKSSCYKYFFAKEKKQIVCYSKIIESGFSSLKFLKSARIKYGLLFKNSHVAVESIKEIYKHYKNLGFYHLSILLGKEICSETEYIQCYVSKELNPKHYFNKLNKSTIKIDLGASMDDIFKNYSRGHKTAINKAKNISITTVQIKDEESLDKFCEIYKIMSDNRKLNLNYNNIEKYLYYINDFINRYNSGFMLASYIDNEMIGGGVFLKEGCNITYYLGASDAKYKKLPISYLIVNEAISITKNLGYKYFDLGGYNHHVDENDQIYNINMFKKGFSKNYVFYPKVMHFVLNPLYNFIADKMAVSKDYLNQIIRPDE